MVQNSYPELNMPARVLLSTGPVNVHPRVYKAMQTPVVGYGEAVFIPVIDGIAAMLAEVFSDQGIADYGALGDRLRGG